jgi:hypothetical protein
VEENKMAAPAKTKLRDLLEWEKTELVRFAKATSERTDVNRRAKALSAVAQCNNFSQAARLAGYKTGDGVMLLVKRFNRHGFSALSIANGRGYYQISARQQVIDTVQQPPDREQDQTATWSLSTLERSLRSRSLEKRELGATTIRRILKAAGFSYQQNRSWCQTGQVKRVRKEGVVTGTYPTLVLAV